jgi:hypothetical protein
VDKISLEKQRTARQQSVNRIYLLPKTVQRTAVRHDANHQMAAPSFTSRWRPTQGSRLRRDRNDSTIRSGMAEATRRGDDEAFTLADVIGLGGSGFDMG